MAFSPPNYCLIIQHKDFHSVFKFKSETESYYNSNETNKNRYDNREKCAVDDSRMILLVKVR